MISVDFNRFMYLLNLQLYKSPIALINNGFLLLLLWGSFLLKCANLPQQILFHSLTRLVPMWMLWSTYQCEYQDGVSADNASHLCELIDFCLYYIFVFLWVILVEEQISTFAIVIQLHINNFLFGFCFSFPLRKQGCCLSIFKSTKTPLL